MLAGRVFTRFQLDIGIGDAVVLPTELIKGRDWLGFAGIAPGQFMAISKAQQFAEKFHAYTVPRSDAPNSRVKDLMDMILLIQMGTMDRAILDRAIRTTFELRGTHAVPKTSERACSVSAIAEGENDGHGSSGKLVLFRSPERIV